MTTYAAFTTAVSGVSITGVTRQYAYAPDSLNTADMPASWIRLPTGGTNLASLASVCTATGNVRNVDLVVCLEPTGQEQSSVNMSDTITMMDNIETALDTLYDTLILEYTLTGQGVIVGGVTYWAVVANVRMTE